MSDIEKFRAVQIEGFEIFKNKKQIMAKVTLISDLLVSL